jgi:hypothetical protein
MIKQHHLNHHFLHDRLHYGRCRSILKTYGANLNFLKFFFSKHMCEGMGLPAQQWASHSNVLQTHIQKMSIYI